MLIRCSHCGFAREVSPDKIPAHASHATCPKCKEKFCFRGEAAQPGAELPPHNAQPYGEGAPNSPDASWPQPRAKNPGQPFAQPDPSAPERAPEQQHNSQATWRDQENYPHENYPQEHGPQNNALSQSGSPKIEPDPMSGSDSPAHEDIWSAVESLHAMWEQEDRIKNAENTGQDAESAVDGSAPAEHQAQNHTAHALESPPENSTGKPLENLEKGFAQNPAPSGHTGIDPQPGPAAESRPFRRRVSLPEEDSGPARQDGSETRNSFDSLLKQRQQERPPLLAEQGSVPWEYKNGFLRPLGLLRTMLLSLLKTATFFSGISPRGTIVPALVFAVIMRGAEYIAVIASPEYLQLMNASLGLNASGITEILGLPQLMAAALLAALLAQFVHSGLIHLLLKLVAPGQGAFNLTFKTVAYASTPLLLAFIPHVGSLLSAGLMLLLLLAGVRFAYRLSWPKSFGVIAPVVLVMFLLNIMLAGG